MLIHVLTFRLDQSHVRPIMWEAGRLAPPPPHPIVVLETSRPNPTKEVLDTCIDDDDSVLSSPRTLR